MRKSITTFLFALPLLYAQASASVPDSLLIHNPIVFTHTFSQLQLDSVKTGILADYSAIPIDFSLFDGTVANNQCANIQDLFYILQGVSSSVVTNTQSPPSAADMITSMSSSLASTSKVPVGIIAYKYNRFSDDAITAGKVRYYAQNDLLEYVYDNNNEWVDPYTEAYVFAFAPYISVVGHSVIFDFSTAFRYSNLSVSSISFDPGDGVFQPVVGSFFSKYYTTAGARNIRLKIYLSDGTQLYAYSKIVVTSNYDGGVAPSYAHFVSEVQSDGIFPSADVEVLFANGVGISKQPVIVAEGFDPISDPFGLFSGESSVSPGRGSNDKNTFADSFLEGDLDNFDVVYINWNNSTASIESNADILRQVIGWVNTLNGTSNRNILIGQSMGGLIARYALCTMESQGLSHNVGVYVSDDSPQLGANVPLGAVYAAQYLFDIVDDALLLRPLYDFILAHTNWFNRDYSVYLDEFLAIRNSKSVRQMLMNYVDSDYELDNSEFNTFQATLRNLGFPQGDITGPTLNLCLSNGGVNDYTVASPLFDVSLTGSIGELGHLLLACILYGAASAVIESPVWWSLFAPSHTSLVTDFSILPYNLSGAKVFDFSITHTTNFIWGGAPHISTLASRKHYAPQALMPLDICNGSYYSYTAPFLYWPIGYPDWAEVVLDSSFQDHIMFIPTVSSLCYKKGDSAPTSSDYHTDFTTAGVNMDQIPFDGYRFVSSVSSYHTVLDGDDLTWIAGANGLEIEETVLIDNSRQFSLNKSGFSPVWSTSNSSIATIDSSGHLTLNSFGTVYIYATISNSRDKIRLKKELTIPEPPFGGFPTYTLSYTDFTPDFGEPNDVFRVQAQPSTSLDPAIINYITYSWGRKVGTSTSITWTETSSLTHFFTISPAESHVVYFRVKYLNSYSATYSILCRARPHVILVDPLGNLFSEDMGESFVQVRSGGEDYVVTCMGKELLFGHEPTLSEICIEMLEFEEFKSRVKRLQPWGNEQQVIIPYTCASFDGETHIEDVIVFIYRGGSNE